MQRLTLGRVKLFNFAKRFVQEVAQKLIRKALHLASNTRQRRIRQTDVCPTASRLKICCDSGLDSREFRIVSKSFAAAENRRADKFCATDDNHRLFGRILLLVYRPYRIGANQLNSPLKKCQLLTNA